MGSFPHRATKPQCHLLGLCWREVKESPESSKFNERFKWSGWAQLSLVQTNITITWGFFFAVPAILHNVRANTKAHFRGRWKKSSGGWGPSGLLWWGKIADESISPNHAAQRMEEEESSYCYCFPCSSIPSNIFQIKACSLPSLKRRTQISQEKTKGTAKNDRENPCLLET